MGLNVSSLCCYATSRKDGIKPYYLTHFTEGLQVFWHNETVEGCVVEPLPYGLQVFIWDSTWWQQDMQHWKPTVDIRGMCIWFAQEQPILGLALSWTEPDWTLLDACARQAHVSEFTRQNMIQKVLLDLNFPQQEE